MKATLHEIKMEFLDLVGAISVEELVSNFSLQEKLKQIVELFESSNDRGAYA